MPARTRFRTARLSEKRNHYAVLTAWTMFYAYSIAVLEKNGIQSGAACVAVLDLAAGAVRDALADLCDELREREHLVEGHAMADVPFYHARQTLLMGLMGAYWFWETPAISIEHRAFVEEFVRSGPAQLWGEACVPQLLARLWVIRASDATVAPDFAFAALLSGVLERTLDDNEPLPSPYYDIQKVIAHQLRGFLRVPDPMEGDTAKGRSFTAEGLLHLLVLAFQRNLVHTACCRVVDGGASA